jgi:hypothetical protein
MEKGVLIFEKCERWFRRDVPEDKKNDVGQFFGVPEGFSAQLIDLY